MRIQNGHSLPHVAENILVGSLRALHGRVGFKERLVVPERPVQHLAVAQRIGPSAVILLAVADKASIFRLQDVVVVVIALRALSRSLQIRLERVVEHLGSGSRLVVVSDKVHLVCRRPLRGYASYRRHC